jgi:starch synthase
VPDPTRILFATSEIFPLIKTGGLADVSGSLPLALRKIGLDVRVLLPGYRKVLDQLPNAKVLLEIPSLSSSAGAARLLAAEMPESGLPVLLLDCPSLFTREGGPYQGPDGKDWPDNVKRFGALCRVGAHLASAASTLDWHPHIVHCNDWQSALIPALLHYSKVPHAKSVMTIHNLAFQGNFESQWVTRLGLPAESYTMNGVEFYGHFSFLKAGLRFADKITTVSKTYASEIQTHAFGCGMEGLLRERHVDLDGIVNGIDDTWNPARDRYLASPYDPGTLGNKAPNKLALQKELGLQANPDVPLLGMVSRLTHQKGIDLILNCADELLQAGVQLAFLGSGEAKYEQRLRDLAHSNPGLVSVTLGYNEELAHRMIAGIDIFLMPSRFEPCGLSQMYSMSYGTLPLVRRTGGLADTVTDTNPSTLRNSTATGFVFEHAETDEFLHAVHRALSFYQKKDIWHSIQQTGMSLEFGWQKTAEEYLHVYRELL